MIEKNRLVIWGQMHIDHGSQSLVLIALYMIEKNRLVIRGQMHIDHGS
jgi:hypothetical protein